MQFRILGTRSLFSDCRMDPPAPDSVFVRTTVHPLGLHLAVNSATSAKGMSGFRLSHLRR